MSLFRNITFVGIAAIGLLAAEARAGITISPFASIMSTKKIQPDKVNSSQENVTTTQRTTYGIKASVGMWRLLKLEGSVGQSVMENTFESQAAVDDFGSIDYEADANIDTSDGAPPVKTTETMRQGRAGIALDPSFSIFILRGKAGVQGTQRLMKVAQDGVTTEDIEEPITYKPYAGYGGGIKLNSRTFFLMEYTFFLYKYPEIEPFIREVSVSFGVSI